MVPVQGTKRHTLTTPTSADFLGGGLHQGTQNAIQVGMCICFRPCCSCSASVAAKDDGYRRAAIIDTVYCRRDAGPDTRAASEIIVVTQMQSGSQKVFAQLLGQARRTGAAVVPEGQTAPWRGTARQVMKVSCVI
jgi:hypothetical protein